MTLFVVEFIDILCEMRQLRQSIPLIWRVASEKKLDHFMELFSFSVYLLHVVLYYEQFNIEFCWDSGKFTIQKGLATIQVVESTKTTNFNEFIYCVEEHVSLVVGCMDNFFQAI